MALCVKEFLVDVWESRKLKLYGDNACPGLQPNSSGWDLGQDGKLRNGRNGRSGKLSHSSDEIFVHVFVDLHVCVCGSAHMWVRGQWQCCYGSCLSIIKARLAMQN